MTRDRNRSRLFRGDPSVHLLGEEEDAAAGSPLDAPSPRRFQRSVPPGLETPTIRERIVPSRDRDGGFDNERIAGDMLHGSATVFDEGYVFDEPRGDESGRPLRIYVGRPDERTEEVERTERVWDAAALDSSARDDEPGERLLAEQWMSEDPTEAVSPARRGGTEPGRARVTWDEPEDPDPFAPPSRGHWAPSSMDEDGRPTVRADDLGDLDEPTDIGVPRGRGLGAGGDSVLRPLDVGAPSIGSSTAMFGDSDDWQLEDDEDATAMPTWALEPEMPPPPPIRMGDTSRLEKELGRHWEAEEHGLTDDFLDTGPDSGAALGSGMREPWDVTVSGAWRRPPHLATGEHRRPGGVVPDFRPVEDAPDPQRWAKVSAAALSVVLVCLVVLQFGSDKPLFVAPGALLDRAWSAVQVPGSPVAGTPRAMQDAPGAGVSKASLSVASAPAPAGADAVEPRVPTTEASVEDESVEEDAAAPPPSRTTLPVWEQAGRLQVTTDFPATVYVDGRRIGRTPVDALELPTGMHDVRVVPRGGGRTRSTRARVDAGRASEVSFRR